MITLRFGAALAALLFAAVLPAHAQRPSPVYDAVTIGGVGGATITSGADAPGAVQPAGSLFMQHAIGAYWSLGGGAWTPAIQPAAATQLLASGVAPATIVPRLAVMPHGGVIPARHLAHVATTPTPKACITGDSTVSQAGYLGGKAPLWSRIQRALRAAYPDKTWTFADFSIGGRQMTEVHGTLSSGWPGWFANHAATWNSYIASAGCTVLFTAFGVNSAGYDSPAVFHTFLQDVAAYSPAVDLIMFTNLQMNPAASGVEAATQAGLLANAAMTRTQAASAYTYGVSGVPPIGIVDTGRVQALALGFDPANQVLEATVPASAPVTGITAFPYTLAATQADYSLSVTFTNGSVFVGAGGITLTLSASRGGTASPYANFVALYPNNNGGAVMIHPHMSE